MAGSAIPAEVATRPAIDYSRVLVISLGHLVSDMGSIALTGLMPYLVLAGRIDATVAGLILLLYLSCSSFVQPIFGHLTDRGSGRLFVMAGPVLVGAGACLAGWSHGAWQIVGLAVVAGIGSSAFHPQAASMVNFLAQRSKGWAMSIFSMGGNIGFALGPAIAGAVAYFGLRWSPIIIVPSLLLAIPLAHAAPALPARSPESSAAVKGEIWQARRGLSLVVGVIALRGAAQYALIIFLPLYYHAHGEPAELGSVSAFVLSLAGALGGLAGGHLSDQYGRRIVVVISMAVAAPLIYACITVTGPLVWPVLILAGAALLAANSVTVVQGQEFLPRSTGIASGLTLGLAFGLSGVVTSVLTTISDYIGVEHAIYLVVLLPLAGALLAAITPRPAPSPA